MLVAAVVVERRLELGEPPLLRRRHEDRRVLVAAPRRQIPFHAAHHDHLRLDASSLVDGVEVFRGRALAIVVAVIGEADDVAAERTGFTGRLGRRPGAVGKLGVHVGVGGQPDAFAAPRHFARQHRSGRLGRATNDEHGEGDRPDRRGNPESTHHPVILCTNHWNRRRSFEGTPIPLARWALRALLLGKTLRDASRGENHDSEGGHEEIVVSGSS